MIKQHEPLSPTVSEVLLIESEYANKGFGLEKIGLSSIWKGTVGEEKK